LFVNGRHPIYECWEVGVAFSGGPWSVFACPGDGISVGAPESFS
jgi:hypothetical protein